MPRLLFEKTGNAVWISHLDLMRVFQRAFRRAGLLLKHSQGFTPRAIVSIALPLSVGVESVCELLDFELEDGGMVTPRQLNEKLPEGIRVLQVLDGARKIKELTHLKAEILMEYDRGCPSGLEQALKDFYAQDQLIMEKHSRKGNTQTDLMPMLRSFSLRPVDENTMQMEVVVCAQNPALNPQLLVSALELYAPQWKPDGSRIRRVEIYDANGTVFR